MRTHKHDRSDDETVQFRQTSRISGSSGTPPRLLPLVPCRPRGSLAADWCLMVRISGARRTPIDPNVPWILIVPKLGPPNHSKPQWNCLLVGNNDLWISGSRLDLRSTLVPNRSHVTGTGAVQRTTRCPAFSSLSEKGNEKWRALLDCSRVTPSKCLVIGKVCAISAVRILANWQTLGTTGEDIERIGTYNDFFREVLQNSELNSISIIQGTLIGKRM